MWIEIKDTLIQIDHMVGVECVEVERGRHYDVRPGETDYKILLYAAGGKCFKVFTFHTKAGQEACYKLLKDKLIKYNYDAGAFEYDECE